MSIIKSIKQVLGLGPAAENHFWDGSVPNQLSLKRGTPDAPGAELIKALNGVLSFPNQGQSLTNNGYVKLPGGLIIQWGGMRSSSTTEVTMPFPVQFPTEVFCICATCSDTLYGVFAQGQEGDPRTSVVLSAWKIPENTRIETHVNWIALGY